MPDPNEVAAQAMQFIKIQMDAATAAATSPDNQQKLAAILAQMAQPSTPPSDVGWTSLPVAADARLIYVSNTGADTNPGTEAQPLVTISAAMKKLRDGYPDRIRLKRGGTWGKLPEWPVSGRSLEYPAVLEPYGEGPPPKIGMVETFRDVPLNNIAIIGVDIVIGINDIASVRWLQKGANILFEGIRIIGGKGFVVQGYNETDTARVQNVRLRRSVIADCTKPIDQGHVQGMYLSRIDGLLVEECLIDNNGRPANIFRHNIYAQNGNTDVRFKNNIITRASSHGLQLRCGGKILGNLFCDNPLNVTIGGGQNEMEKTGITFIMKNNVIIGGGDITPVDERGWGVEISNTKTGEMSGNVIAHGTGGFQKQLQLVGDLQSGGFTAPVGVLNTTIVGNTFHNWDKTFYQSGDRTGTSILDAPDTPAILLVDPTRKLPAGWLESQRVGWSPEWQKMINWIRAGYAKKV